MPKEWLRYKAELKRLYVLERKTLDEVKDIFKAQHGFIASTRMYRMKFDEWGLRKYKTNNRLRSQTERLRKPPYLARFPSPPSSSESCPSPLTNPTPDAQLKFGPNIIIPARPLELSELLPLIQGGFADEYALQILITKWQKGGEYMECAGFLLRDPLRYLGSRGIGYIPQTGRALFSLIYDYVPVIEQFPLTKAILEADLSLEYGIYPYNDSWIRSWRSVSVAQTWDDAKRTLSCVFTAQFPGKGQAQMFLDSALVVIAERFLKKYMDRLEGFRAHTESLSLSDTFNRERCSRQYLAILKDFNLTSLDLSPSWYKYSLQIMDWNSAVANQVQESRYKFSAENHQKYRKLISLYTGIREELVDDNLNDLIATAILYSTWGFESDVALGVGPSEPIQFLTPYDNAQFHCSGHDIAAQSQILPSNEVGLPDLEKPS